jgi:hypothetical protein
MRRDRRPQCAGKIADFFELSRHPIVFIGAHAITYDQVVAHFDRVFDLGLSSEDQRDLVAYLTAVGDGVRPCENDGVAAELKEISDFASTLGTAIPAHDKDVIALVVNTLGPELRELTEAFPDLKDTSVSGGEQERALARMALKELVLALRRIGLASAADRFDEAAGEYGNFRRLMASAVPMVLAKAQPWSLFNSAIHEAHYAALRQMIDAANHSSP